MPFANRINIFAAAFVAAVALATNSNTLTAATTACGIWKNIFYRLFSAIDRGDRDKGVEI